MLSFGGIVEREGVCAICGILTFKKQTWNWWLIQPSTSVMVSCLRCHSRIEMGVIELRIENVGHELMGIWYAYISMITNTSRDLTDGMSTHPVIHCLSAPDIFIFDSVWVRYIVLIQHQTIRQKNQMEVGNRGHRFSFRGSTQAGLAPRRSWRS